MTAKRIIIVFTDKCKTRKKNGAIKFLLKSICFYCTNQNLLFECIGNTFILKTFWIKPCVFVFYVYFFLIEQHSATFQQLILHNPTLLQPFEFELSDSEPSSPTLHFWEASSFQENLLFSTRRFVSNRCVAGSEIQKGYADLAARHWSFQFWKDGIV